LLVERVERRQAPGGGERPRQVSALLVSGGQQQEGVPHLAPIAASG
jgi:hypothetical protein